VSHRASVHPSGPVGSLPLKHVGSLPSALCPAGSLRRLRACFGTNRAWRRLFPAQDGARDPCRPGVWLQIDLRYANKGQGDVIVVVAPVLRFKDVGFNADISLEVGHLPLWAASLRAVCHRCVYGACTAPHAHTISCCPSPQSGGRGRAGCAGALDIFMVERLHAWRIVWMLRAACTGWGLMRCCESWRRTSGCRIALFWALRRSSLAAHCRTTP